MRTILLLHLLTYTLLNLLRKILCRNAPGLPDGRCAAWLQPTRRRAIPFASAHVRREILGRAGMT